MNFIINKEAFNKETIQQAIVEKAKKEFEENDEFNLIIKVTKKEEIILIKITNEKENELIWEEEIT